MSWKPERVAGLLAQLPEDSFEIKGRLTCPRRLSLLRAAGAAVRRGKLIQILLADVDLLDQLRLRFAAFFWLVQALRLRREVTHEPGRIVARAFKFLRMPYGPSRADFRAQAAIHALTDIDIELGKPALLAFFIHLDADGNAGDRADALARETAGAD